MHKSVIKEHYTRKKSLLPFNNDNSQNFGNTTLPERNYYFVSRRHPAYEASDLGISSPNKPITLKAQNRITRYNHSHSSSLMLPNNSNTSTLKHGKSIDQLHKQLDEDKRNERFSNQVKQHQGHMKNSWSEVRMHKLFQQEDNDTVFPVLGGPKSTKNATQSRYGGSKNFDEIIDNSSGRDNLKFFNGSGSPMPKIDHIGNINRTDTSIYNKSFFIDNSDQQVPVFDEGYNVGFNNNNKDSIFMDSSNQNCVVNIKTEGYLLPKMGTGIKGKCSKVYEKNRLTSQLSIREEDEKETFFDENNDKTLSRADFYADDRNDNDWNENFNMSSHIIIYPTKTVSSKTLLKKNTFGIAEQRNNGVPPEFYNSNKSLNLRKPSIGDSKFHGASSKFDYEGDPDLPSLNDDLKIEYNSITNLKDTAYSSKHNERHGSTELKIPSYAFPSSNNLGIIQEDFNENQKVSISQKSILSKSQMNSSKNINTGLSDSISGTDYKTNPASKDKHNQGRNSANKGNVKNSIFMCMSKQSEATPLKPALTQSKLNTPTEFENLAVNKRPKIAPRPLKLSDKKKIDINTLKSKIKRGTSNMIQLEKLKNSKIEGLDITKSEQKLFVLQFMSTLNLFLESGTSILHCAKNEYGRVNPLLGEMYINSILVHGIIYRDFGGPGGKKQLSTTNQKVKKTEQEFKDLEQINNQFNESRVENNKTVRSLKVKNRKVLMEELKRLADELRDHIFKRKSDFYNTIFNDLELRNEKVDYMISDTIKTSATKTFKGPFKRKKIEEMFQVFDIDEMFDKNSRRKRIHEYIKDFEDAHGGLEAMDKNCRVISKSLYDSMKNQKFQLVLMLKTVL